MAACRFRSPVGDWQYELWPRGWYDANPFGNLYNLGYHTGADLNMRYDADAHAPVFAIADGEVIHSRKLSAAWGWVVVIRHPSCTGPVYARYAHVEAPLVAPGDWVSYGQQIASIGSADGRWPYHLHFDLSTSEVLNAHPEHWPGMDWAELVGNYIDPLGYIARHTHPSMEGDVDTAKLKAYLQTIRETADAALAELDSDGVRIRYRTLTALNLRSGAGTSYKVLRVLAKGEEVVYAGVTADVGDARWVYVMAIKDNLYGWCNSQYLERL